MSVFQGRLIQCLPAEPTKRPSGAPGTKKEGFKAKKQETLHKNAANADAWNALFMRQDTGAGYSR